jgi:hypothetical protein
MKSNGEKLSMSGNTNATKTEGKQRSKMIPPASEWWYFHPKEALSERSRHRWLPVHSVKTMRCGAKMRVAL